MRLEGRPAGAGFSAALFAAALAVSAPPAPARAAELLRCLDPGGGILFTNTSCPEGYALDARWPARVPAEPLPADAAPAPAPSGARIPEEPAPPGEPEAPPAPRERVDERCAVGSFETRDRIGGFDVRFTNRSARACRGVSYYCLWGVVSSVGFYRQSAEGRHEGLIGPGETVELGTIRARGGPADREVVWSWCVPRGPAPSARGREPAR